MRIVLVHGTFASDATWISSTGNLARTIQSKWPEAEIHPFQWCGGNSHSARRAAGAALGEFLHKLSTTGRDDIFIISHSHGGNVAIYALTEEAVSQFVRGCVFLGTPFLSARKRSLNHVLPIILILLPILLAIFLGVAFSPVGMLLFGLVLLMGAMHIGFIIGILYAVPKFRRAMMAPWNWYGRKVNAFLEKEQGKFYEKVSPHPLNVPCLVVFAKDDEARLWLGSINIVSESIFIVLRYLTALVREIPKLFVSIVIVVVLSELLSMKSKAIEAGIEWATSVAAISLALFALGQVMGIFIPAVARGHRAGFGWEGALSFPLVAIGTSDTPKSSMVVTKLEIEDVEGRRGLLHSAYYGRSDIICNITSWMDGISKGSIASHEAEASKTGNMERSQDLPVKFARIAFLGAFVAGALTSLAMQ